MQILFFLIGSTEKGFGGLQHDPNGGRKRKARGDKMKGVNSGYGRKQVGEEEVKPTHRLETLRMNLMLQRYSSI